MTTTNATFLAPTKKAVELRFKAELKRNPFFERIPSETKERFLLVSNNLCEMLETLEGLPQAEVDEIVNSDQFWNAMTVAVNNTADHAPIVKAIRNIITDLCA